MRRSLPKIFIPFTILVLLGSTALAQNWVQQPTALQSNPDTYVQVGGLWGIAVVDSGTGFAAGYASVTNGFSGVLRKTAGNPTWFVLPSSNFSGLATSHSLWSAVAAVGTSVWVCGSNGRIYKSTNNGNNWASSVAGITGTNTLYDIFFKSASEGMVVGSNGTIYYSSNGGSSWVQQTLPASVPAATPLYAVHSAGGNWYVSGGAHTLIRGAPQTSSTSWTDQTANVPSNLGLVEGLQFLDNNTGTIAGATLLGSPIFRTTDGGGSFTSIGSGLPSTAVYNTLYFFDQDYGWTGNAFQPLYETTDGGQNWTSHNTTTIGGSLSNLLTRIDFGGSNVGYASGGAPGTTSTGWILRYELPLSPDISQSATALDLDTLECAKTIDIPYLIRNRGTAPLDVTMISFSSTQFTLAGGSLPSPIAVGGSATIHVRWTPTQAGPIPPGTTMTISSNDPQNPSWVVDLSGVYNKSRINISGTFAFPTTCLKDSSEISITVQYEGNLPPEVIAFEHVSGDDQFTLVSPAVGSTVSGSPPFVFRFRPSSTGSKSGTYRLITGLPGCPEEVLLTFTGNVISTSVSLSTMVVDFGDVCVGHRKNLQLTVTNNGDTEATITSRQLKSGTDRFPNQHFTPFGPIPVGAGWPYNVQFAPNPSDTGLIEATYMLFLAPCRDTVLLTMRGRAVNPKVEFSPQNLLSIGPVAIGQTVQADVEVRNLGSTAVTVAWLHLNPTHPRLYLSATPALPLVLGPGQNFSVTVEFTPDRIETLQTELCVGWSDPCADSTCLPIVATSALEPTFGMQHALNMGTQYCPEPVLDSVYILNTGSGPLLLSAVNITGADKGYFSVPRPAIPATVSPGDSVALVIAYDAPVGGTHFATVEITHNDPKSNHLSMLQLTGRRVLTGFSVEGDTTTAIYSCAGIGQNRTFVIRNTGLEPIDITEIEVQSGGGEFNVAGAPLPATVQPGSGLSFEVNFTPPTKGSYRAVIRITSEPCSFTYLVTIDGEGNQTQLTFSPDPVNFGSVTTGSTIGMSVTVRNTGATAVSVSDFLLNPPLGTLSIVSAPPTPVIINAGGMRVITIEYSPLTVETLTASFCVVVTSPCADTICVPLLADVKSEGLALNRSRLDFVLDPCTPAEACDTVQLVNNGSAPIDITALDLDPQAQFRIDQPPALPFTLDATSRITLRVCALADFVGSRSGTLTVRSTDPDNPVLTLALEATRDSSGIRLSRPSLDFGAIAECEIGTTLELTIENTGTITEFVDLLPGGSGVFTAVTSLPVAVQPGVPQPLTIAFEPTVWGSWTDTLLFRSSRCGIVVSLVVRGSYHEINYRVSPDPLVFTDVPVGGDEILNFVFENLELPSARIIDIRIQPSGEFSSWGTYPKLVNKGSTVQLPILFSPSVSGSHAATACIILDSPCPDTLCVSLQGTAGKGELVALPARLDFGAHAQCENVVLYDTLRNEGGRTVTLQSSAITGSGAAAFSIANPVTIPEALAFGEERVFEVHFHPLAEPEGPVAAMLEVGTDDPSQPQVDIPLGGNRTTLLLAADRTVDFGNLVAGLPAFRTVSLSNNGTTAFTYSSMSGPATIAITPPLPLTLQPGETKDLTVQYTPDNPGTQDFTIALISDTPCVDSTLLRILAEVSGGLLVTEMDFGIVASCLESLDTMFVRNEHSETATIETIDITGADGAYFSIVEPRNLPVALDAGALLRVIVAFQPDGLVNRGYTAQLNVDAMFGPTAGGKWSGTVTATASVAKLSPVTALDFGAVTLGIGSTRTFTFVNSSAFPVHALGASITPPEFAVVAIRPPLPLIVQPGGTLEVDIRFMPASETIYDGSLAFSYDDPCSWAPEDAVTGRGIDNAIHAGVRLGSLGGSPDEIVRIPILLDTDTGPAQCSSWTADVAFNRSMLYPLSLETEETLSADMSAALLWDHASAAVHIEASGAALRSGTGVLAYINCLVLIGDATSTVLSFEDFEFTSGSVLLREKTNGAFDLEGYCLAGGNRLIRQNEMFTLMPNSPNPFNPFTTISYSLAGGGFVQLSVFDPAGKEIAILVNGEQKAGNYNIRFDATGLPAGLYFYSMRYAGRMETRKMVVTH